MAHSKAAMLSMKGVFEGVIWQSRLIVVLAVVASLVSAMMISIMAAIDIFKLALSWVQYFVLSVHTAASDSAFHTMVITQSIGAITDFLLAMLLFVMAWGLYELFISKLSRNGSMVQQSSDILVMRNLDDFKDRIIKISLLILVVLFFKHAMMATVHDMLGFLYLGGGILMVALALFLSSKSRSSVSHK